MKINKFHVLFGDIVKGMLYKILWLLTEGEKINKKVKQNQQIQKKIGHWIFKKVKESKVLVCKMEERWEEWRHKIEGSKKIWDN